MAALEQPGEGHGPLQGGAGLRDGSGGPTSTQAPRSVGELFFGAVERFADAVAMRRREPTQWTAISWQEFGRQVEAFGAALVGLGVAKGDRVAILSNSRVEWAVADIATMAIGAVTVPVYHSSTPSDVQYVLAHAEAKVVVCEDREQLAKVLEVRAELPALAHAVLVDGKVQSSGFVLSYPKLLDEGRVSVAEDTAVVRSRTSAVGVDDVATIVYTSGTTGPPKGAVLTQGNLLFELDALSRLIDMGVRDETLLFLPMAHIFARLGYLLSLCGGFAVSYAESIDRLMVNLQEIRPTFVFSVPRIYEKVYGTVMAGVQRGGRIKKQIFAFAMAVGTAVSKRLQSGRRVPFYLSILFQMAELLVFNKLKKTFGGSLRFFISGGAPLSRQIAEFFHAAGLMVLEGYGLTENAAAACLNVPEAFKLGSVGRPLPGCDVRIAEDGEILLRGGNIFQGYYRREEASREALDGGWFHTGDIGEVDEDGFVRITDRKKDLIVTSGGKNIAPQNIENLMKTAPMVSQVMVYGDKRSYLTALVTLDPGELQSFAERHDIEYEDLAEVSGHPAVFAKVEREIEARNKTLASFETIKKFAILERDFEIGEELTPTLKVKRKVATEKYLHVLESLYQERPKDGAHKGGGVS